jgi:hypothetical protein
VTGETKQWILKRREERNEGMKIKGEKVEE